MSVSAERKHQVRPCAEFWHGTGSRVPVSVVISSSGGARWRVSIFSDFSKTIATEPGTCSPGPHHEELLNRLLDEVLAWAEAFRPLREQAVR